MMLIYWVLVSRVLLVFVIRTAALYWYYCLAPSDLANQLHHPAQAEFQRRLRSAVSSPYPDSQPMATELFQSSPFGSGTVFRSTSHLRRHFPSSALAWTVLFIILLSCLRSDIVILDTLIVLLTFRLIKPAYYYSKLGWVTHRSSKGHPLRIVDARYFTHFWSLLFIAKKVQRSQRRNKNSDKQWYWQITTIMRDKIYQRKHEDVFNWPFCLRWTRSFHPERTWCAWRRPVVPGTCTPCLLEVLSRLPLLFSHTSARRSSCGKMHDINVRKNKQCHCKSHMITVFLVLLFYYFYISFRFFFTVVYLLYAVSAFSANTHIYTRKQCILIHVSVIVFPVTIVVSDLHQ